MKKIFTSISLAAMSFMATVPGMAQEQRLTDEQKAEVIATVVPAVFDQVKQISGIDIMQLANPSMKSVLESPLFGTQSMLRAEATATPVSIQPDSAIMNFEKTSIKLEFSNYKTYNLTNLVGAPVTLNFPEQITTSKIMGLFQAGVTIKTGEKNGLLPFSTLNIGLDLGTLNMILGWTKANDILTMKESMKDGVFTYDIALTEELRSGLKAALKLIESVPQLASMKPVFEALIASPNYRVAADMTKQQAGEIGVAFKAVTAAAVLPLNDAKILIKKDGTKEIITTNYEKGTANVEDYDRTVMGVPTVEGTTMTTVNKYYEATILSEKEEDWRLESTETTILKNANDNKIDPKNLIASIVGGIIKDMATGKTNSFSMEVKEEEGTVVKTVYNLDVTPSMEGAQAMIATIQTKEDEKNELDVVVRIPMKGQTVKVDFYDYDDAGIKSEKAIATMYIKSNLLSAVGNETITPELDITITPAENGLYINNCENATYSIVSMSGKMVANGVISGNGAFVATPYMQRGQIYIVTVVENGAKKSIKIMK